MSLQSKLKTLAGFITTLRSRKCKILKSFKILTSLVDDALSIAGEKLEAQRENNGCQTD